MFSHLKISARLNSSSVRPWHPILMSTVTSELSVDALAACWQENVFNITVCRLKLYFGQNRKDPNKALKPEVLENLPRCAEMTALFVDASITITTVSFFSVI